MKINVTRSSMPPYEEYCEEILELWDSHWLTNMGVKHEMFQAELEKFLDCTHVSLFTNGHLALENAIAAFDFPVGSEIITTPFTFASTTHAIVRNNLIPVFCDVREDDCTLDTNLIEDLITEKTVAILPVHVYGNVCDVDAIDGIAKKYGLKVIYDAAHAFGVKYKGQSIANYGDASIFSFHATKVFNTIEGGAVCFKDNSLVERLNDLKNFGIHGPESVTYVGGNAKMSEFQAAMGICNLRHFKEEITKRKIILEYYDEKISTINGIKSLLSDKAEYKNYSYYPVCFTEYKKTRDNIYELLKSYNIYTRKYFYPLTCDYECYKNVLSSISNTQIARQISENVLTLPLYSDLNKTIIDKIFDIISSV